MTKTIEHTSTFELSDGDKVYTVFEFTVYLRSNAGGITRWVPVDRYYETPNGGKVSHKQHQEFQLPGKDSWLVRSASEGSSS